MRRKKLNAILRRGVTARKAKTFDRQRGEPQLSKRKERRKITSRSVTGLKYFERLVPLLKPLHQEACQRDKAGNRQLHYDEYCLLVLLYLFNPIVSSLRAIQQASELQKVQQRLGVKRASLGSLSEAARIFDANLLEPLVKELGQQLTPLGKDARLGELQHTLTLVDGTLITALPLIAEACWRKHNTGSGLVKWRIHTHFEVERFIPSRMDVTRNGGGECDERAVMERNVESDHCYIFDRGYAKYLLFNKINAVGSSYVCRLRDNSSYEILESASLSAAAREARVIQDAVVMIGETHPTIRPDHAIRLIVIEKKSHPKHRQDGKTGPACDGYLRIATNLLDVPAEIIALLYEYRWTIEIFFRFFKQILGCRHLISHDENGIQLQTYCAIIACMLISLWTGRKPTKRTYEMVCFYFMGLATERELLAHLEKLQPTSN